MSKSNLFFSGVVLKNTRNLIQEDLARKQLDLQREAFDLRKEELTQRRLQNRRQNVPNFEDFGRPNAGELNPYINNSINNYINYVSENYENLDFGKKKSMEVDIINSIGVLSKIDSDYRAFQTALAKGGDAFENARYFKDRNGNYTIQKRYEKLKDQLNKNEITPDEFAKEYYKNTEDDPLFDTSPLTTLGKDIVSNYKGPNNSYLKTSGGKDEFGYTQNAINDLTQEYERKLMINQTKDGTYNFATQEGEYAYFNTFFEDDGGDLVNAQKLFMNNKVGGIAQEDAVNVLDPSNEDFDEETAKEYAKFLAREDILNNTRSTFKKATKKDNFKDINSVENWEKMQGSVNIGEKEYGSYGKMLTDYTFTQKPQKVGVNESMLQNMQVLTSKDLDNKTAKNYLINQANNETDGTIKTNLETTAISEDHENMYAIFSVTVSNEATKGQGSKTIEFAVPITNISNELLGKEPLRWKNSTIRNAIDPSTYGTGEQTGGGEQTGRRVPRI